MSCEFARWIAIFDFRMCFISNPSCDFSQDGRNPSCEFARCILRFYKGLHQNLHFGVQKTDHRSANWCAPPQDNARRRTLTGQLLRSISRSPGRSDMISNKNGYQKWYGMIENTSGRFQISFYTSIPSILMLKNACPSDLSSSRSIHRSSRELCFWGS